MRPVLAVSLAVVVAFSVMPVAKAQDADAKQVAEAASNDWVNALNKGDPKAVTALFTSDGFTIDLYGKHSAAGADTDSLVPKLHAQGLKVTSEVSDVQSLDSGKVLVATGTYTSVYEKSPLSKPGEINKGNWMRVLVKDGSEWKTAGLTLTRLAPAPKSN
jgi:uncharacterized protein (TIGR02246 family)